MKYIFNTSDAGKNRGFTLVELLISLAIISLLATMAIPAFNSMVNKAQIAGSSSGIKNIQTEVFSYYLENDVYPNSLNDIGRAGELDSYDRPFQYQRIANNPAATPRQDNFFNDLNQDFDLYSLGKDGLTTQRISDPDGLDDIVRGGDGGFIGKASNF